MPSQKLNLDQPAEAIDAAEARMRLALGLGTQPRSTGQSPNGRSGGSHHATTAPGPTSHDSSARPRRRFAQDGDVPVVMLGRGRDGEAGGEGRFASLTSELREEKTARGRAERALDEANLSIQSLRTKLAHLEMACEEKLRGEREARSQIEALRSGDQEARNRAETRQAETALALSMAERRITELEAQLHSPAPTPATDLFGEPAVAVGRPRRAAKRKAAVEEEAEAATVASVEESPVKAEAESEAEEDQPIEWWLPSFRAQRNAATGRKRK